METLEKRLRSVYPHLIDEHVVIEKFNKDSFIFDEYRDSLTLHLVTNYLSMSELKVLNFYCSAFGLVYSIISCPNIDGNNLTIIIEDDKR